MESYLDDFKKIMYKKKFYINNHRGLSLPFMESDLGMITFF